MLKTPEQFISTMAGKNNISVGKRPLNVLNLRKQANKIAKSAFWPNYKIQTWQHTDLNKLFVNACGRETSAANPEPALSELLNLPGHKVVFTDGRLDREKSDYQQIKVLPFEEIPQKYSKRIGTLAAPSNPEQILTAINTAKFEYGYAIIVPAGDKIDWPVYLIYLSNPGLEFYQPRNLIMVEAGARAQIVENISTGSGVKTWVNKVSEIFLQARAQLDYYCWQNDHGQALITSGQYISLAEQARLNNFSLTVNLPAVRNQLEIHLAQRGAQAELFGLYLLKKRGHLDNQICLKHQAATTTSRQLYQGLLHDQGTAVFNGQIQVRPPARGSRAEQINKNILLSDQAAVYTQPQLNIFTDNIKCRHGSYTGDMDDNSLVYLRSRGLSAGQARRLLLQGFAREIIEKITIPEFQEIVMNEFNRNIKLTN